MFNPMKLASTSASLPVKSLFAGCLLSLSCVVAGAQTTWVDGDVFAGVGNGQYNVYSNTGTFKETITDSFGNGYTTGCAFTSKFDKLYTTNFENDAVTIFDATGKTHSILKTLDTSSAGADSESVVFDMSGNYYVGHADGAHGTLKFSPTDTIDTVYYPATENRGTDWVDIGKDQSTIFYTSEGAHLKRFDTATNSQLTDFSVAMPGSYSYAHKLLPPYDGTGGALVSDSSEIVRLDKNGNVSQTYNVSGAQAWFSLDLDPNGTSFWAGDLGTSLLYRFNIASGNVEIGPINTIATNGIGLGGVCVEGELSAVTPPMDKTPPVVVVQSIVSGPPKEVILSTHDTQSGLATLEVLECTNCTAVNGTFKVGSNADVLTTATKTNQSESSTIKLEAIDVAGNVTIFDPVDFDIRDGGKQDSHTVNISPLEHVVMIQNGTPGVRQLQFRINGRTFIEDLTDGASKTIDIQRYMPPVAGSKVAVTVTAYGPTGASAWIVITQK